MSSYLTRFGSASHVSSCWGVHLMLDEKKVNNFHVQLWVAVVNRIKWTGPHHFAWEIFVIFSLEIGLLISLFAFCTLCGSELLKRRVLAAWPAYFRKSNFRKAMKALHDYLSDKWEVIPIACFVSFPFLFLSPPASSTTCNLGQTFGFEFS